MCLKSDSILLALKTELYVKKRGEIEFIQRFRFWNVICYLGAIYFITRKHDAREKVTDDRKVSIEA